MIANVHAAIQYDKTTAEQLAKRDHWQVLFAYVGQRIVGQIGVPTPPPTLPARG